MGRAAASGSRRAAPSRSPVRMGSSKFPRTHSNPLAPPATSLARGPSGTAPGGIVVESSRFDWAQGDRFPSMTDSEPAYHGLKFYENFGDFAFRTKARAVALRDFAPTLSPTNAFRTLTGIETLHLRMDRHVANAQRVAEFLSGHPRVAYAGLKGNPFHDLASKYLPRGGGGLHPSTSRPATRGSSWWKAGDEDCVDPLSALYLGRRATDYGDTRLAK
jgi:Cys/Met metabolism PLP-dependent enzyme